ncbi:MAG: hypothetical protein J7577_13500 [Sphingobacteriaceae bacterium]|nr:hypothetical protein [Sphingobacteriaceae bacterium]
MTEESKRFRFFCEKYSISAKELSTDLERDKSIISKWLFGKLKVPYDVLKHMHYKYHLNFNWYFLGTGPMKTPGLEKNTLVTDLGDLTATIKMLVAKQEAQDLLVKKLVKAIYDRNNNTQNRHKN